MSPTSPVFAENLSGTDRCWPCDDTGYVTLKGTTKRHGVEYSRGVATCKWCEMGRKRYGRMVELKQHPDQNFGIGDVEGWDDDDRPASREDAKRYIAQIQQTWAKPRPAEAALKNESRAQVERRIANARAQIAKEDAAQQAAKAASRADAHSPQAPPRRSEPAGTPTPSEEGMPY